MNDKKKRELFGLAARIVLRRQRRRRQQRGLKTRHGRSWVKPHIREHDTLGAYVSLVESLRNGEPDEFVKFLRLTPHISTMCSKKLLPSLHGTRSSVAERVIKATRCDWLLATTKVDFARTLHNFRLTDSIFESVSRLLSWFGQQHTNVLASLRPAYITQLVGVSRQIIRHLGVSRLMYARHNETCPTI